MRLTVTAPSGQGGGSSGGPGDGGGGGSSNVVETTTATPVTFEVPAFLPVSSGNAGQGTLTLSFDGPGGVEVTCNYKGAALSAHPTEDLDKLFGLRYYLLSCSDGTQAGDTITTTRVALDVESGDDQFPGGPPTVNVDLGDGCSGSIPPPMQAAEVAFIRQEFDWLTTEPLEELNPQGKPAIWHGLIYIERKEQLVALDQAKILWSTHPFTRGYSESLIDKCGRMEHSTDGSGVMVYALFPARWWNTIRAFAFQAAQANIDPPFQVIAPSSPDDPEMLESDGSISYPALAKSGYLHWLQSRSSAQPFWDDIFDYAVYGASIIFGDVALFATTYAGGGATDVSENIIDYTVAGFVASMEFVWMLLDDVWETLQEGMQEFAFLFTGRIELQVSLSMRNIDPGFAPGSPLVRAWGPSKTDAAGNPIVEPALDSTGALAQTPVLDVFGSPVMVPLMDTSGGFVTDSNGFLVMVPETTTLTVPARPRLNLAGAKIRLREWVGPLWTMDEREIPESGIVTLEHSTAGSSTHTCIQLDAK